MLVITQSQGITFLQPTIAQSTVESYHKYGTAQMQLHTHEVNTCMCERIFTRVNIYANDQAKSLELREFTQELTQPSKHLFLSSNSAIFEGLLSNCR